jgi:integrase
LAQFASCFGIESTGCQAIKSIRSGQTVGHLLQVAITEIRAQGGAAKPWSNRTRSGATNGRPLTRTSRMMPCLFVSGKSSGMAEMASINEAEIAEVWQAFGAEGGAFCDLFKLLLLTGQRRGEVVGMRRAELSGLDGDKPVWDIPSDRTKNSRPHSVPLAPQAVTIINARPEIGESGLLFTTTGRTPISAFSKTKERVDGRIARRRGEAGLALMPDWTLHDLRRTMVTMMNERLGIAPHVVESCVNHISGGAKAGVAGVYNKALYLTDRRAGNCPEPC